jgi:hypothetical protein
MVSKSAVGPVLLGLRATVLVVKVPKVVRIRGVVAATEPARVVSIDSQRRSFEWGGRDIFQPS